MVGMHVPRPAAFAPRMEPGADAEGSGARRVDRSGGCLCADAAAGKSSDLESRWVCILALSIVALAPWCSGRPVHDLARPEKPRI